MISRDKGPRLYLYLFAVEAQRYLKLFDFTLPESEDPDAAEEVVAEEEKCEAVEEKYVQAPSPVKPQIQLDEFAKLDLRVCKVLSCKAMRKANKLYKIVVHDGMGRADHRVFARRRLHARRTRRQADRRARQPRPA